MRIVLQPHETIKRRRAKERLAVDADLIHSIVRSNPGISSRTAIAIRTGLSQERVTAVMKRINEGDTGHIRLEYGRLRPRGGPNAGQMVRGWFVMNRKAHHEAMDQADEHGALVELGVRRGRLVRFAQASGIRGAEAAVAAIEERLGLSIEAMSQADLEAFEGLLLEEAEELQP